MIASPSTRALGRWLPGRRSSAAVLLVGLVLAVVTGAAVAGGRPEPALMVAVALVGVAVLRELPLAAWCVLLLVTTVAMRGVVTALGLPEILNFLHYPVTAALAVAALQRPYRPASRAPAVWLTGLVLVSMVSLAANLSHPLRGLVFLLIVGEPLVIIWALTRWGVSARDRAAIGTSVLVLALVQFPIGAMQATRLGLGDPVQGTLTGHGAGHHVLGALFALALLVATAGIAQRRVGVGTALIAGALSLAMMVGTGSMAVTILTALTVPLVPLLAARMREGRDRSRRASRLLVPGVLGVAFGVAALMLVQTLVPGIYERARRLTTPEASFELRLLSQRADDPGALAFGSGPGTSASRASVLLIAAESQGSPLAFLGLKPTPQALEVAASTRDEYGGSAESARSSALGIIGDLGLLGLAGLGLLFLRMWQLTARSGDWLAPAAQAALVLTGMLAFVDSWLEYPEFAVPLALLLGAVLSEPSREPERISA